MWVLHTGIHLRGAHRRTSGSGNCIPRGWYVRGLMSSAVRKANTSVLACSSSSVRLKLADLCYPMRCINGMAAFLETAAWNSNFVKIHQASWKLSLQSPETRALAGLLSQHIWRCAVISISECTSTYSLFFSQLLTPSVSTPRIACWRINRVLPLLHMAVLQLYCSPLNYKVLLMPLKWFCVFQSPRGRDTTGSWICSFSELRQRVAS